MSQNPYVPVGGEFEEGVLNSSEEFPFFWGGLFYYRKDSQIFVKPAAVGIIENGCTYLKLLSLPGQDPKSQRLNRKLGRVEKKILQLMFDVDERLPGAKHTPSGILLYFENNVDKEKPFVLQRGSLYNSLDNLVEKNLVIKETIVVSKSLGGRPQSAFRITEQGRSEIKKLKGCKK